jgi:hypothetical protein
MSRCIPHFASGPSTTRELHPDNIFATPTQLVYYNGLVPYTASVNGGTLLMKQQDTTVVGHGTSQGPIDTLFKMEGDYVALQQAVLEMNGGYTALERVDASNYKTRTSYELRGRYDNGAITLPYTFVASRVLMNSLPFALKASPAPSVRAGDTLLVQSGRVTFK